MFEQNIWNRPAFPHKPEWPFLHDIPSAFWFVLNKQNSSSCSWSKDKFHSSISRSLCRLFSYSSSSKNFLDKWILQLIVFLNDGFDPADSYPINSGNISSISMIYIAIFSWDLSMIPFDRIHISSLWFSNHYNTIWGSSICFLCIESNIFWAHTDFKFSYTLSVKSINSLWKYCSSGW